MDSFSAGSCSNNSVELFDEWDDKQTSVVKSGVNIYEQERDEGSVCVSV